MRTYSYAEAHKMKLKANSLEGWELEKQQNQRQQQMFKKEAKFKHKQQQESRALKKRITSGRETQKRQRQFDLERCACDGKSRRFVSIFGMHITVNITDIAVTSFIHQNATIQTLTAIPECQARAGAAAESRAYSS